jgi:hypothetical protein
MLDTACMGDLRRVRERSQEQRFHAEAAQDCETEREKRKSVWTHDVIIAKHLQSRASSRLVPSVTSDSRTSM